MINTTDLTYEDDDVFANIYEYYKIIDYINDIETTYFPNER
jgi:hypothetical protein